MLHSATKIVAYDACYKQEKKQDDKQDDVTQIIYGRYGKHALFIEKMNGNAHFRTYDMPDVKNRLMMYDEGTSCLRGEPNHIAHHYLLHNQEGCISRCPNWSEYGR